VSTTPADLEVVRQRFGWRLQQVIWSSWLHSRRSNRPTADKTGGSDLIETCPSD